MTRKKSYKSNSGNANSGVGILNNDYMENAFSDQEFPNMANFLVKPGDNVRELLSRTNLFSDEEINDLIEFLAFCREINWEEGLNMAQDKLAARTSMYGWSREQLVATVTMQTPLNPHRYGKKDYPQKRQRPEPEEEE